MAEKTELNAKVVTGDYQNEKPGADEQYCSSCGSLIKKAAEVCPKCGVRQKATSGQYSKVMAGLLAIVLGSFGAHKFYLGYVKAGIVYLIFVFTLIPLLLGIIEGIIYLIKSDEDFQKTYVEGRKSFL